MKRFIQSNWPYLFLVAAIAAIFSPCLGKYILLPSPDSGPFGYPHRIVVVNQMLSGKNATAIQDILQAILPPWLYNDCTYPLDTFLIALGFGWFMRIRGANRTAAAFGGLCFALMGYSLTLFSAGHRAFFFMTLYAVLMFAFLARAAAGGNPLNWPLAALCAVWALRFQPDFAAIYIILAAIYTLCLMVRGIRMAGASRGRLLRRLACGAAIGLISFAIAGAPTIITTLTSTLDSRKEQIGSGETIHKDGSATGDVSATDDKWIFTTNWSLPPDEVLEFVAPAVKGRQTGDPALPYWGRLGRSWKWEETHQGFMNFRQHVVYLGAIPIALALLALLAHGGIKKRESQISNSQSQISNFKSQISNPKSQISSPESENSISRSLALDSPSLSFDIRFWSAVWVVGLLLAFGRYTPFYKLFYHLPYLSYLRAPVKFVRLVEFATSALAAFGATALVSERTPKRTLRHFALLSALLSALLACFAAFAALAQPGFLAPLTRLGADASLVSLMRANAVRAIFHGVVGFALVAVAAFGRSRARAVPGQAALAALAAAVAIDAVLVARPFAYAEDMEYKYTDRNIVTSAALDAARAGGCPSVGILVRDPALQRALRDNLSFHSAMAHPRDNLDHAKFLAASPAGEYALLDLLDATGCNYVLIEASQADILRRGRYRTVATLAPRKPPLLLEKRPLSGGANGYILAVADEIRPYARLFDRWVESSEESLLADAARNMCAGPGREALPVATTGIPMPRDVHEGQGTASPKAICKSVQGLDGAFHAEVETNSPRDAMLLLHRPFNQGNCALLDGRPVPQYKAGYCDTAVFVPAGRHVVRLSNEPRRPAVAAFSFAAIAIFFVIWGLVPACHRNHE